MSAREPEADAADVAQEIQEENMAENERLKKKKRRKSNKTYKIKRRYVKTKRMKQVIKEEERMRRKEVRHVRRYLAHEKVHMPTSCGFNTVFNPNPTVLISLEMSGN